MDECKIGLIAPNKVCITFDGSIGSFLTGSEENPLLGLCQLKRKVGPVISGEKILTEEDFPDIHSPETPCVLLDFRSAMSIDVMIEMLKKFKKDYFSEK